MKIRLLVVSTLLAIGLAACGDDAKKAEAAKAEAARCLRCYRLMVWE
jgi:hypothetical protein